MSVIIGLNDGIITRMNAAGTLDVAAWPRLFHGVSCLAAGCLADIKKRSLLPICTGCVLTMSTLGFFFLSIPGGGNLNLSLLYMISGVSVVYLTLVFMDMAPYTKDPTFWAGMERITRSACVALVSYLATALYDLYGVMLMLIVSSVLPVGYQEAFSFNLLIGGKAVYDKKTGTLTLYIPQAYQKAGRTYAILGVNQTGKATVFTDTDQDSTKITINLNDIEGYAFSLIYSD